MTNNSDHISYCRSLIMCWPEECVPAMEWAKFIRTSTKPNGPYAEQLFTFAAFIDSVYGRWLQKQPDWDVDEAMGWLETLREPDWLDLSVSMSTFFTHMSPKMDPMKLGFMAHVKGGSVVATATSTDPHPSDENGEILNYFKIAGQPIMTTYRAAATTTTMLDSFPANAALAMAWAILYNRMNDRPSILTMRSRWLSLPKLE